MAEIIIQSMAAAYMIFIGVIMKTEGGIPAQALFKVVPVSLGGFLAFHVYAHFMGWPA